MHYGLAYEAHATRLPSYYPTAPQTVVSHAYHGATAGGAEAPTVPLHSVSYHHIHSAITPLNDTPGHHRHPHHSHHPHHPQPVLQYSPQAGSLPYHPQQTTIPYPSIPYPVAAVNC